jgi:hypothetical protein
MTTPSTVEMIPTEMAISTEIWVPRIVSAK